MSSQQSVFTPFTQLKAIEYGSIRSQPLLLDVFLPKSISPGVRPILVNFHGGGLIGGRRTFEPFWSKWLVEWAIRSDAIVVAPDYPLAPESKTPEIVDGIRMFTDWLVHGQLQKDLDASMPDRRIQTDTNHIMVVGESAGSWCALHMGFLQPKKVNALVLRFPMMDLESEWFVKGGKKFGVTGLARAYADMPESILDEHLEQMVPGKIVSEGADSRFGLAPVAILNGRILDLLGRSEETFPLRDLSKGRPLPKKVWVYHCHDDSVCPLQGSEHTVALIKENVRGTEVELDVGQGDHGFDTDYTLEQSTVKKRIAWLEDGWLEHKG